MATKCRKTKLNKNQLVNISVYGVLTGLVITGAVIGLVIGRVSAPVKTETIIVEAPITESTTDSTFYYDVPLSHSLQKHIYEICDDEDVPVPLVLAMIEHESGFNHEAVSTTEDTGLMQINKVNHDQLDEKYRCDDMLNPYQNVYSGIKIVGSYLKKYDGDITKALMAYNMGEYGASKAWEDGVAGTNYTASILELMDSYIKELQDGKSN
jgi:hypothetical protein